MKVVMKLVMKGGVGSYEGWGVRALGGGHTYIVSHYMLCLLCGSDCELSLGITM